MTQIKIDKGVPIPAVENARGKGGRRPKYPFVCMEIGDSFFTNTHPKTVRTAASTHYRRHNKKFTTRSENGGTRVWRIA